MNKKEEIKRSIVDLEGSLLKENIVLTKSEKDAIYKNLTNEITNNDLIKVLANNED